MFACTRLDNAVRRTRKRGVVAVYTVVMIAVMLGFAALTVDVGVLYNTRADLQDAADAAALASVTAYTSDSMMQLRMNNGGSFSSVNWSATDRASTFAGANPSFGTSITYVAPNDLSMGWLDLTSASSTVQSGGAQLDFNASQVVVKRTADGPNGAVAALFSRMFGSEELEVQATAVAVFDDRVAGYDSNGPANLLPFTVHEDVFNDYFLNGPDSYEYDSEFGDVDGGNDGVREVKLYPHDNAPGNFGLLNVGTPNQGVPALRDHIDNGIPPEDFEAEIGTDQVTFYDDDGDPVDYEISGNPGLKATLESNIEDKIGQVVGFFIHDGVSGNGANTVYNVTQLRFGRVMYVNLKGGNKAFWIQPVSHMDSSVITSANAPSSGGLMGRVMLAR